MGKEKIPLIGWLLSKVLISHTYVHTYKYKFSLGVTCGFQRSIELLLINLMLMP